MEAAVAELALLNKVYAQISNYSPSTASAPPILDSSVDFAEEGKDLTQKDHIPGLKSLRESIRRDLDALEIFVNDPQSVNLPPLSTNAPYLIAVWKEVLCAPQPIVALFKSMPLATVQKTPLGKAGRAAAKSAVAKVDIVADNGKKWIRINTLKNSRMLAEFREIDSYLTESEESSDDELQRPSLAQKEFDNSVLRMGRDLIRSSKANPVKDASEEVPEVVLRLTRLDPNEPDCDPRIKQTIQGLTDMGIGVELGETSSQVLDSWTLPSPHSTSTVQPTERINLDLSILIALVSDLTHSPLPSTADAASSRFIPPQEYREWKKTRLNGKQTQEQHDLDLNTHSRALANQCLQEMGKGVLQEIHDRVSAHGPRVQFWSTVEARDRCLRIVSKIGGESEKRRLRALFPHDCAPLPELSEGENQEELYWRDSRYPAGFLPLLPIRVMASFVDVNASASSGGQLQPSKSSSPLHPFFPVLADTCRSLLAQEAIPHPRPPSESPVEILRATVMKANPKLTAHTVHSLLVGAELGWTTLTANKTSVKAILREVGFSQSSVPVANHDSYTSTIPTDTPSVTAAAIWITDPRSLAEGMRSDR